MTPDFGVRSFILATFVDHGRPPSPEEIAAGCDLSLPAVRGTLERLAEAHAVNLAPGSHYILMANPFSGVPTSFKVTSGQRSWWGNCIWDGLGILAMLDIDGRVESSCPDCGERLRLDVSDGVLSGDEGVVHFSIPPARWWDDIGFT